MGELSDDVRSLIEQEKPFLPQNISEWREVGHIRPRQITSAYLVWRHLEHTFSDEGYSLYIPQKHLELDGLYHTVVFPPTYFDSVVNKNKLGAYGSNRYIRPFPVSLQSIFATFNFDVAECSPLVWAALNRAGDEVVIKVIYDGHSAKGLNELKILKHLSRQDVRADFRNRTIPVLEFIEHAQYVFAVFPRWTDYPIGEVKSPKTAIECCAQITEVLAFLHDHRIAHLDISHENIMINVSGFLPGILRPVEHLSIRYHFIDFGESVLLGSPSDGLPVAPPRQFAPRPTSAPEVGSGKAFNPFAADVYQVAIFMLEQFYDLTGFTSDFLPILQAMTRSPEMRISMADAHERLASLRDAWNNDATPYAVDKVGRRLNKYVRTHLNTYRAFPGSIAMPRDCEEARRLRQEMRDCRQDAKKAFARYPSGTDMLHVDPVWGALGWVHGNNVGNDTCGE